jgi:hypothetical protein
MIRDNPAIIPHPLEKYGPLGQPTGKSKISKSVVFVQFIYVFLVKLFVYL